MADAEEREQRLAEEEETELAERAQQFAAGACLDNEEIDWAAADSAPNDPEEAVSDGEVEHTEEAAAAFDAAYMQLAEFASSFDQGSGNDTADASNDVSEESWEKIDGFVRPGCPGFNNFVRTQMQEAGIPSNRAVMPPEALKPTEWVASPVKPKLQPYQETVTDKLSFRRVDGLTDLWCAGQLDVSARDLQQSTYACMSSSRRG